MRRADLEHLIRAAAAITSDEIVVVGSQSVLGQFPNAPERLLVSLEADVYPRRNPSKSIEIDGAMGDGSMFHETFGYYAHGVGPETPNRSSWLGGPDDAARNLSRRPFGQESLIPINSREVSI